MYGPHTVDALARVSSGYPIFYGGCIKSYGNMPSFSGILRV